MDNLICRFLGHKKPTLGVLGYPCCDRCQRVVRPDHTSGCVVNTSDNQPWILCLDCKRKSYHPKDVEYRYCGCCHKFHPPLT